MDASEGLEPNIVQAVGPSDMQGALPVQMPSGGTGISHELSRQMSQMQALMRELISVTRQQLDLQQRSEQRAVEQQQAQRDEWQRWLAEYRHLRGRCKGAEASVRNAVVRVTTDMVEYIEENSEALRESEFSQRELADKYGSLLYQLWNICGVLRRLSAIDQTGNNQKPQAR